MWRGSAAEPIRSAPDARELTASFSASESCTTVFATARIKGQRLRLGFHFDAPVQGSIHECATVRANLSSFFLLSPLQTPSATSPGSRLPPTVPVGALPVSHSLCMSGAAPGKLPHVCLCSRFTDRQYRAAIPNAAIEARCAGLAEAAANVVAKIVARLPANSGTMMTSNSSRRFGISRTLVSANVSVENSDLVQGDAKPPILLGIGPIVQQGPPRGFQRVPRRD